MQTYFMNKFEAIANNKSKQNVFDGTALMKTAALDNN